MLSGVGVLDGPGGLAPQPKNGDVTACVYCTAVLEFREVPGGLALVELTGAERIKTLTDLDAAPLRAVIMRGPVPPPPGSRRH
jgi:Lon protease-like protein